MSYILTEEEFNAVDTVCVSAKLVDDGFYISQTEDGELADFFVDGAEKIELREGLLMLADAIDLDHLLDEGYIDENQLNTMLDLFDKFDIDY